MASLRDSPVLKGTVCLSCGDKGEAKLLIYCGKCGDSAVHHYCMDDVSPDDDNIFWVCWECAPKYKERKLIPEILPSQSEEPVNDPTSSRSHQDVHHMSGDEIGPPLHALPAPIFAPLYQSTSPASSSSSFSSQSATSIHSSSTPTPAPPVYPSPGRECTSSDPPSSGKVFLFPEGSGSQCGYRPSKHGTSWITFIITNKLDQPYKNWQDIPDQVREMWFREWKRYVTWDPQHEIHMRKAFKSKASHRLGDIYSNARKTGKRPIWMAKQIWEALCGHWASIGFQKKSEQAKKSRASKTGGSLHTGGCISIGTHTDRMAQELGRPPTQLEVFARTHKRRADNSWVDERSQKTAEAFQHELMISQTQSWVRGHKGMTSANSQRSEIDTWERVVGGRNKRGRLYGMRYQQRVSTYSAPVERKSSAGVVTMPYVQARVDDFGEQIDRMKDTQELLMQKLDQLINQMRFPPYGPPQPHSSQRPQPPQ